MLDSITHTYEEKGFNVGGYHGDNEFRPLIAYYSPIPVHVTAAGEHNGVIERSVRTVEERSRSTCHSVPFSKVPHVMIEHLLLRIIMDLNAFPTKTGISSDLSPASIVLQTPSLDYDNIMLAYGSYCQVYTKTDGSMRQRSVGAIALRPSNERGGFYFMSLNTGKLIHAFIWEQLPLDDHIIDRVTDLAEDEGAPLMNNGPIFEWRPGIPVTINDDEDILDEDDDSDDEDYIPPLLQHGSDSDSDDDDDDDDTYNPSIDDVDVPFADGPTPPVHDDVLDQGADLNVHNPAEADTDNNNNTNDELDNVNPHGVPIIVEDVSEDDDEEPDEDETNTRTRKDQGAPYTSQGAPTQPSGAHSRPRRTNAGAGVPRFEPTMTGKTHETHHTQLLQLADKLGTDKQFEQQCYKLAVDVIFTQVTSDEMAMTEEAKNLSGSGGTGSKQMSAKRGIKLFGERAVAAIYKEYKQLNDLEVFKGVDPDTLTFEVKKAALNIINTIKEKRTGKIKGRSVADGRKQRGYVTKEESSSPTLSLEALLTTTLIDAVEERDVVIFDVPGAFLQAAFPDEKFVLVKLEGEFVDIMCKVNPELKQYVRIEGKKKVLYLRLLKALYGCMESALLWYNLFVSTLKKMNFEINPYDRCVANRIVEGEQQTICFYVDDNKLSHKSRKVNEEVINKIESYFGKMEKSYGNEHSFLGMMIRFIGDGKFEIDMTEYQMESITAFGEDPTKWKKVSSPATKDLHNVNTLSPTLNDKQAEIFHSVVMKNLWIAKRGRPDIDPAMSFLCTRVSEPTMQDWSKLRRVLQFMYQTIHEKRVIGARNLHELFTWIDAAYGVHRDMRSHTGGAMSFGYGIVHYLSAKQKLNVKSSTEAEVVGMSDYLPFNIWLRMFLEEQGYYLKKNVLYQDNQSAIRMETNGRSSCTGNSRHIHVRFFFVKDRLDKKEFTIEYCPTQQMLGDFYTKPLQGRLFRAFRRVIMGWDHIDILKTFYPPSKERVGEVNEEKKDSNNSPLTYADIVKGRKDEGRKIVDRENKPKANDTTEPKAKV